jgi:hypothetical protein
MTSSPFREERRNTRAIRQQPIATYPDAANNRSHSIRIINCSAMKTNSLDISTAATGQDAPTRSFLCLLARLSEFLPR